MEPVNVGFWILVIAFSDSKDMTIMDSFQEAYCFIKVIGTNMLDLELPLHDHANLLPSRCFLHSKL